jgi:hypothetical protein
MLESGIIVALGLIMWFFKCSWKNRLRILSYPLAIDVIVFIALTAIHWGTFTGVMAATVGALACSILLTLGRKAFGHMNDKKYVPGFWNVSHLMEK